MNHLLVCGPRWTRFCITFYSHRRDEILFFEGISVFARKTGTKIGCEFMKGFLGFSFKADKTTSGHKIVRKEVGIGRNTFYCPVKSSATFTQVFKQWMTASVAWSGSKVLSKCRLALSAANRVSENFNMFWNLFCSSHPRRVTKDWKSGFQL